MALKTLGKEIPKYDPLKPTEGKHKDPKSLPRRIALNPKP